ncbi:MAG: glycosyltransferase 61 family protein [Parvularculaceae bacterium]
MQPAFLFRAATSFLEARLSAKPDFKSSGARETVICPEEHERLKPAIMLDGAGERMRNYMDAEYRARMTLSFAGGLARHAPTLAYTFTGGVLAAGSFLSHGFRYRIRPPREAGLPKRVERLGRIALCASITGDHYFGHSLNEDLPQMLLAPDFGEPARLSTKNWPDLVAYRSLLDLDWRELDGAELAETTIFLDYAQNSSRKARFAEFRRRLRDKLTPEKRKGRFYLRRGDTGVARSPVNDADVCAAMERRGYDVFDVEGLNSTDFIKRILERSIMVSVEGSHMMHLAYTLRADGGALALMPPARPRCAIKDACDAIGAHFATVVGHETEGGYTIDIGELNRTLDLLERKVDGLEAV